MDILKGFQPCHIGTLDFALCRDGFLSFWLNFLEAVFQWQLLFFLQKNAYRKFGEEFGGKFR